MNAQKQSVKPSRGLAGEDRSYRDPEQGVNLALAGALQEFLNEGKLDTAPSGEASPGEGEQKVATPIDMTVEESATSGDETTPIETAPPASTDSEAEAPVTPDRRGVFHQVARDHVAGVQAARSRDVQPKEDVVRQHAQFVVAPILLPEPDPAPRKPKQLPKDAPWERVTLGKFLKSNNTDMVSLVREIRSDGKRPVLTLEIRAPEGKGTRVDFTLSITLGKGGNEHVKLKALAAHGVFAVLVPQGTEVYHDELVCGEPSIPERFTATVKVNGILNTMNAFLTELHLARGQQR